jgi:endonuclease G
MAPAGDMPSPSAMAQSLARQHGAAGPAEQQRPLGQDRARHPALALRAQGDVYVITGPVFEPDGPRIGANAVRVPSHLYKLVYDAHTGRAWAHWMRNRRRTRGPPISYAELVRRTGIDFLGPQVH